MNIEQHIDGKRFEMMRERYAYFKKLIDDWMMIAAGDFVMIYEDFLVTMGNEIVYNDPGDHYGTARININLANGDSEEYTITSQRGTGYARVSSIVICKANGITTEVDISQKSDNDTASTPA